MLATAGILVCSLDLEIGQRMREGAIGVCNQVSPYVSVIGFSSALVSFRRGIWRVLLVKPEIRRPLGGARLRCENNDMGNFHLI